MSRKIYQPTYGSLFAGIGGIDLAFTVAGFDIVWQVEIDEFCRDVLAKHWPQVQRYSDILECHNLPYVDVITAGFPCQPFSVAGKMMGRDDERFLVPEMLRVIGEVKPSVVLLENVPGFASLNAGAEFKSLLRALAAMGYDAEWGYIRASDIGAPHRRERWFLVAYSNGQRYEKQDTTTGQDTYHPDREYTPEIQGGTVLRPSIRSRQAVAYTAEQRFPQRRHAEFKTRRAKTRRRANNRPERPGIMEHPHKTGRRKQRRRIAVESQQSGSECTSSIKTRKSVKPTVCRSTDGLSCRMDIPRRWPAPPNQPQYFWEPPRTTGKTPHRVNRIKALGNAVVPAQVLPLAITIREWLESEKGATR